MDTSKHELARQLFTYADTDFGTDNQVIYISCLIVHPFGPFKKDEHVAWIELDYVQSSIVCENEAEERIYEGRLVLGVE